MQALDKETKDTTIETASDVAVENTEVATDSTPSLGGNHPAN